MRRDPAVDFLLDCNGAILEQEKGYWIGIEARLIDVSEAIPHGIRNSLTLHDPGDKRILGYDNAHAIKRSKKFKYAGRSLGLITNTGIDLIMAFRMNLSMPSNCLMISGQMLIRYYGRYKVYGTVSNWCDVAGAHT